MRPEQCAYNAAMIALFLATLSSAGWGLVLRWAQQRKCNVYAVGLVNYVVATLYEVAVQVSAGPLEQVTPVTVWLGVVVGVMFAVNYGFFGPLLTSRGVSVTTAIVRLSVVIPIVAAIVLWHEMPQPLQYAGIGLTLLAMPLITLKPSAPGGIKASALPLLLAMFIGNGASTLLFQAYEKMALPGEDTFFLICLFLSASLVLLIAWRLRAEGSSRRDIIPGIVLGLTNAVANVTFLDALRQLPGVIVFPFYSAVGLVVAVVAAWLIWGERISRRETLGLALAIIAVVLVNLG